MLESQDQQDNCHIWMKTGTKDPKGFFVSPIIQFCTQMSIKWME